MQNWGEDITKLTIGNESLHEGSNGNSVKSSKCCVREYTLLTLYSRTDLHTQC
jgi:hypothetical protein